MKPRTPREFPSAFLNASDVKASSPRQIANFAKRLDYIAEITETIMSEPVIVGADEFREFLSDLELDVSVNHNSPPSEEYIAPWLVHSSWTFDLTSSELRAGLSEILERALEEGAPLLNSNRVQFSNWLKDLGIGLREALDSFYDATSYSAALANLIAMDVLLAKLLAGLSSSRLMDFANSSV